MNAQQDELESSSSLMEQPLLLSEEEEEEASNSSCQPHLYPVLFGLLVIQTSAPYLQHRVDLPCPAAVACSILLLALATRIHGIVCRDDDLLPAFGINLVLGAVLSTNMTVGLFVAVSVATLLTARAAWKMHCEEQEEATEDAKIVV